jgi:hypothetical protein
MNLRTKLALLVLAAVSLGAAASAFAGKILPAWTVGGNYAVQLPPGFSSLASEFSFPIGDGSATLTFTYDDKGLLHGSGVAQTSLSIDFYGVVGNYTVDPVTGVQHVHVAQDTKVPLFTFDGDLEADGGDLVGTYSRGEGFAGIPGTQTAVAVRLARKNGAKGVTSFALAMKASMDVKGRIKGTLDVDGKTENRATLTVYGNRVLADGKIRGKVKTLRDGTTNASITIKGPGWTLSMTGPVGADGFHATCALKGGGFNVSRIPVLFYVTAGPPGPPPPPPSAPKNYLGGATATIQSGQVTITHTNVPSKFFGATAGLTLVYPTSDAPTVTGGIALVHANPSNASTATPRRCIVSVSGTTYGTAQVPADVTFEIRSPITGPGGTIRVLATGTVVAANGRKKTVNVLVEAIVQ